MATLQTFNATGKTLSKTLKVGVFSTYVPKQDGIATFAKDTVDALRATKQVSVTVCAVSAEPLKYPPEVAMTIRQQEQSDYARAAEFFNTSDVDVVLIEHEFGIFGGANGKFIINFLRKLTKPSVITLHTVPFLQTNHRRRQQLQLLRILLPLVGATVVTTKSAKAFFRTQRFPKSVVDATHVIHHGAPPFVAITKTAEAQLRTTLGIGEADPVLLSFGLITPNKGIQHMLAAMRTIVRSFPHATYVVAGRLRPGKSEAFYRRLTDYTAAHGLQKNVIFLRRYLSETELRSLIALSTIVVIPHLLPGQVSSGTLAAAMVAGRPVVATPFAYATELMGTHGTYVQFRSSESLAKEIQSLLRNKKRLKALADFGKKQSQEFLWPTVADTLLNVLRHSSKAGSA